MSSQSRASPGFCFITSRSSSSGIAHLNLLASLLEYVAEVLLALEVAETLAADDALRPFLCDNVVELVHVQRTAALVDEGADAVFESFALFLVLQSVMVMVVAMSFLVVNVVVMVMMLVVVIVVVMMMVVVFFLLFLAFDALNPSCGCGNLLEVEFVGVEQLVKIDVAIVACDDVGVRLKLAQYSLYAGKLFGSDLRSLVEENLVAELHLLYDEAGEVFLTDVVLCEVVASGKLVLEAQSVNDGDDGVEFGNAFSGEVGIDAVRLEPARRCRLLR